MSLTKAKRDNIARTPFTVDQLVEFCGTKRLATDLLVDLGDSLQYAELAEARGDSNDTEFELCFWDGRLVIDDDDRRDVLGVHVDNVDDFNTGPSAYIKSLDATIYFCQRPTGARYILIEWHFQESEYALTAWYLTKDDKENRKR